MHLLSISLLFLDLKSKHITEPSVTNSMLVTSLSGQSALHRRWINIPQLLFICNYSDVHSENTSAHPIRLRGKQIRLACPSGHTRHSFVNAVLYRNRAQCFSPWCQPTWRALFWRHALRLSRTTILQMVLFENAVFWNTNKGFVWTLEC